MRRVRKLAVLWISVLVPGVARGAPEPPPSRTDPSLELAVPSATPYSSTGGKGHRHDGFYFRFGIGPGVLYDPITSTEFREGSFLGAGLTGELLFGGTVARGLVVGGGTNGATVYAPTLEIEGRKSSSAPRQLGLSVVGPALDYYFDPSRGFHVQALLGFAILQADGSTPQEDPVGVGVSVGGGNEWWVGDDWSIGIAARLLYSRLWYVSGSLDETHSVWLPGLLGTLTYH